MVTLKIDHAGPLCTIQDQGRQGHMRFGVSPAGAMDRMAHSLAHYALGIDIAPAIEISMGGLSLTCQSGQVTACLAGGDFSATLDGQMIPAWSTFTLTPKAKLQIRPASWGSWCYLAFAGALDVPTWLNSASTVVGSNICGAPLAAGDVITLSNTSATLAQPGQILDATCLKPERTIRVVLGPQDHFFAPQAIQDLQSKPFTLTADYNRQGVRLSGAKLDITHTLDMPSEPIARGSLQVAGHGDPVCLLADHQTTGGYPKIATVISADQDKIAQSRTGDHIRFAVVDLETATQAAKDAHALERRLRSEIDANRQSLDQKLWNSNLVSGVIDAPSEGQT